MAIKAYILITADPGHTADLAEKLAGLPGVVEIHEVMGPYDIVVEYEGGELSQITEALRHTIRPLPGIRNTVTCVTIS
jgi:DNA-binding Lrp family transcriptional regulator